MTATETIQDYIDNQLHYPRTVRDSKHHTDEVTLPTGEQIIVTYADISITGTDRSKPQIRIFTEHAVESFKIARAEKKRFFCFTIYSSRADYVKYMKNVTLEDYILSIETDMTELSGRMDIRSLYEWLDSFVGAGGTSDYIRCNKADHSCAIYQASFIKIKDGTTYLTDKFEEYLSIFDLRPYYVISHKSFEYEPLTDKEKRNIIAFGAPGTGKSYSFKKVLDDLHCPNENYERVTFFADYSYSQFVGCYKPIDVGGVITYKFVPGPFMRILVKALKSGMTNDCQKYYLIIEEINRAKAAAVFGDIFQLLDRDDSQKSEYSINASEDIRNYLADVFGGAATDYSELRIPNNMFIWATMNSADQGVFPIDTAFKRRWAFKYIGVDDEEFEIIEDPATGTPTVVENQNDTFTLADGQIEWNVLRRALNSKLSSDKIRVHEDKLMGPFFMKVLDKDGNSLFDVAEKDKDFIDLFCDKVLMYLFEDAAKTKRVDLFEGCDKNKLNRYSYVRSEFEARGLAIFGPNFRTSEYSDQETERDDARAKKVR